MSVDTKLSEIVIVGGRVYHLGLAPGELAQNVFVVGDPARAVRVSKRFDAVEHRVSNREYVTITGRFHGLPVSVIGTGIGTDNVEIALVEAYILNEFDFETRRRRPGIDPLTIIRIGTSGGVQSGIAPGVFGIASYALGLDSTGPYYDVAPADDVVNRIEAAAAEVLERAVPAGSRFRHKLIPYASKASTAVTDALVAEAAAQNAAFEVGITVSAPGFYGPSSRFIDGLTNTVPDIKRELATIMVGSRRVINMEMESSLLFHLCGQLNYQAGTICPIISNPVASAALVDYDEVIDTAITIGLNAMLRLARAS